MTAEPDRSHAGTEVFSPNDYWEGRLAETWGFAGVGLGGHGHRFNKILYRVRRAVFIREVRALAISVGASDVLDVGSGAGFYVDLWSELGARSIIGSDLTQVAVTNLRRTRANISFIQLDIGDVGAQNHPAQFDVVSAFDVFFHIVDDERFRQALRNISSLLKPGGWLLFSDALLTCRPEDSHGKPSPHVKWRPANQVRGMLEEEGFDVLVPAPVFVLLNPPIDTQSPFFEKTWSFITRLSTRGEATGAVAAAILYPLERALLRFTRLAPSIKLLAAQRRSP